MTSLSCDPTEFHRGNVAFTFDLDETLFKPNNRDMDASQADILTRLSNVTDGAVCFVTNNNGASAYNMYPHAPCVSEFGLVWREPDGSKVIRLKQGTPPLDLEGIDRLLIQKPAFPHPLVKKEVGINFNYFNTAELMQAHELATCIMDEYNLHGHYEVIELVDSVEIVPVNVCKSDAMPMIQNRPEFEGRKLIMVGDSSADYKCMATTGFGVAVGNAIDDAPELLGRVPSYKEAWTLIDRIVDTFEKNAHADIAKLTANINAQYCSAYSRQCPAPSRAVLVP